MKVVRISASYVIIRMFKTVDYKSSGVMSSKEK